MPELNPQPEPPVWLFPIPGPRPSPAAGRFLRQPQPGPRPQHKPIAARHPEAPAPHRAYPVPPRVANAPTHMRPASHRRRTNARASPRQPSRTRQRPCAPTRQPSRTGRGNPCGCPLPHPTGRPHRSPPTAPISHGAMAWRGTGGASPDRAYRAPRQGPVSWRGTGGVFAGQAPAARGGIRLLRLAGGPCGPGGVLRPAALVYGLGLLRRLLALTCGTATYPAPLRERRNGADRARERGGRSRGSCEVG